MKQFLLTFWLCLCFLCSLKAQINTDSLKGTALKEVAVRAKKKLAEQKLDRIVINISALLSNTGTNALEVLNNLPGVEVLDNTISLKGRQGVMVYIDDRPTYLSGKDLGNYLATLPSGTIDKIEIMSNPPARYNAAGTGGIINIKTKKQTGTGLNAGLTLDYGSGRKAKIGNSGNISYRTGRFSLFGALSYSDNGNFYKVNRTRTFYQAGQMAAYESNQAGYTLDQHNFETNRKQSTNYKTGIDYEIDKQTSIGFLFTGFNSPYHEEGDYKIDFLPQPAILDSTLQTSSNLHKKTTNASINFNLKHRLAKEGQEVNINLDYLNFNDTSVQSSAGVTYRPGQAAKDTYLLASANPFNAKIYSAKGDLDYPMAGGIKITAGIQSTYSVRNSIGNYSQIIDGRDIGSGGLNNKFNYHEYINAAYLSLQKDYKRLSFQLGLRFEDTHTSFLQYNFSVKPDSSFKDQYSNLFPTAYLSYKLDSLSDQVLIFSAGRRITRPDYADLNPSVFIFDRYSSNQGNPIILPEFSNNLELSYTYKSRFTLGLNYTLSHHKIIQYYQLSGYALISTTINIDRSAIAGIYGNTSFNLTPWWSANIYASLSRARYTGFNGISALRVTTFNLSGSQQFELKNGWTAAISGSYRTNTTYGQGIYLPIGRLNASLQKKILKDNGSLTLNFRDLLYSWNIRRTMSFDQASLDLSNQNDTRQVGLSFNYRFGTAKSAGSRKNGIQTEEKRAGAN